MADTPTDDAACDARKRAFDEWYFSQHSDVPDLLNRVTDSAMWVGWSAAFLSSERELTASTAKVAALQQELETERMRLVACDVIAMANTKESAEKARAEIHPDYLSPALTSVMRAVDAEIAARDKVSALQDRVKELEADAARWDEVLRNVRGERIQAAHYKAGEMFRFALPDFCTDVNIMRGSVAEHFSDHVDKLIARRVSTQENTNG